MKKLNLLGLVLIFLSAVLMAEEPQNKLELLHPGKFELIKCRSGASGLFEVMMSGEIKNISKTQIILSISDPKKEQNGNSRPFFVISPYYEFFIRDPRDSDLWSMTSPIGSFLEGRKITIAPGEGVKITCIVGMEENNELDETLRKNGAKLILFGQVDKDVENVEILSMVIKGGVKFTQKQTSEKK